MEPQSRCKVLLRYGGILCASTSFRDARENLPVLLPRPSAMASAKLANSTVNQRIMAIASVYPLGASFNPNRDTTQRILVKIADTKTRNMTGFLPVFSDLISQKESLIALPSIFRSAKDTFLFCTHICKPPLCNAAKELSKRTKGKRREEAQRTDQQYHNNQQENKHSICGRWKGARSPAIFFSQPGCLRLQVCR